MKDLPVKDPELFYVMSKLHEYNHERVHLNVIKDGRTITVETIRRAKKYGPEGGEKDVHNGVCRITNVKTRDIWKLYWKRASGKWELYDTYPSLAEAVSPVRENENACFWG